MMDWTDRHCRTFHRLPTRRALLYTEMVTTGALLHGDVPRHLDFDAAEHPVALQLGGSEPSALVAYMEREHAAHGTPWHAVARHMMGLYNGLPGARCWRQVWSDHRIKSLPAREVFRLARAQML